MNKEDVEILNAILDIAVKYGHANEERLRKYSDSVCPRLKELSFD